MKQDRLYAITLYLLNHGKTSASALSQRFEVSVRTIQRDIDLLCQAGIPITALTGSNGGYEILDSFRMNNQLASKEDYSYIATALRGLKTVTNNTQVGTALEKITAISPSENMGLILDFSVLREGGENLLQLLQNAVICKKVLRFSYTNNNGESREHEVEPIVVIYKWYSWYLLAYNIEKEDYRTYKLVRMGEVDVLEKPFSKQHRKAEEIAKECDILSRRTTKTTKVRLVCQADAVHRIKEYLNGYVIEQRANGSAILEMHIVESEQWWIGVLMSLGKNVEVLEPLHIRERLIRTAEELILLYAQTGTALSK